MSEKVFKSLIDKIEGRDISIVFPEGEDIRVLSAAVKHQKDGILKPVVLGRKDKVETLAKENNLDLDGLTLIDPESYERMDEMVSSFLEIRKGKATEEQAVKLLKEPNYLGTMMVQLGIADGMISGAVNSTGDTVRPALQIIKTKPGVSRTSGAMVMIGPKGEKYLFADIAINIELTDQEVAEIAIASLDTADIFDIEKKVAMLSFSTQGSASCEPQEKISRATQIAQRLAYQKELDVDIDGEMQFDAAIAPEVAKLKMPESKVAGQAKIFVFPELQSGNIGYKIAQRLGGYQAIGPILQGLNKPINDLSRGCNEDDVYKLAIVTAAQVE